MGVPFLPASRQAAPATSLIYGGQTPDQYSTAGRLGGFAPTFPMPAAAAQQAPGAEQQALSGGTQGVQAYLSGDPSGANNSAMAMPVQQGTPLQFQAMLPAGYGAPDVGSGVANIFAPPPAPSPAPAQPGYVPSSFGLQGQAGTNGVFGTGYEPQSIYNAIHRMLAERETGISQASAAPPVPAPQLPANSQGRRAVPWIA